MLACELIDNNGKELLKCVNQYIEQWNLEDGFKKYVNEECTFCGSLVDRIVPGRIRDPQEVARLEEENHYSDPLTDVGEVFGLWVIEGDEKLNDVLPFKKAGLIDKVFVTPDMSPYKKRKVRILNGAHTGFVLGAYLAGQNIVRDCMHDEVIKGCIGEDYRRYAPYLLTAFFFVLVNNLMGILPIFPGGANVTGNIAITLVLALCTFLFTNICGTKAYWKDIFWPKVPLWLKVPVPLMPMIELFGIFTKPFALMIRLFANIMAGHAAILSLVAIIFITVKAGPVINGSMTVISVLFGIFMDMLELLVAFIQAYVFTMLSAVFIGLSRVKEEN